MFISALASVLLTAVAVWLIWSTLEATKLAAIHAGRAVDEAMAGTEAALLAAKEAERSNTILRVEQRPWLSLQRKVECTFESKEGGANLRWSYTLTNHGRTPALDVFVHQKLIRSDHIVGDKIWAYNTIEETKRRAESSVTTLIIFPDQTTLPYYSGIGQKFDTLGEHHFLVVCVVYRGASIDEFGVEARIFAVNDSTDETDGRKIWKLLEHQRLGVVE